jgi:predicted kinase
MIKLLRQIIRESISRPKIYVLVGPPGVGKSWWVRKNVSDPYIISYDNVVDAVRAPLGLKYDDVAGPRGKEFGKEVKSRFKDLVAGAVSSGKDIVVDMTNMGVKSRSRALAAIKGREMDFEKIAVFFDFRGMEDLVQRSVDRRSDELGDKHLGPSIIGGMIRGLEVPTREEGFDDIIIVDPSETLNRT